jgi:hypothetical protein
MQRGRPSEKRENGLRPCVGSPTACRAFAAVGQAGLIGAKCYQLSAGIANPAAGLFVRNQKTRAGKTGGFSFVNAQGAGLAGFGFGKAAKR